MSRADYQRVDEVNLVVVLDGDDVHPAVIDPRAKLVGMMSEVRCAAQRES